MWSPSSFFLTHRKICEFHPIFFAYFSFWDYGFLIFKISPFSDMFLPKPPVLVETHVLPCLPNQRFYTLKTSLKDEGFKGDIITWKSHTNLDLFWGFSSSVLGICSFSGAFSSSFMDMYCIGHMYIYIYI